MGDLLHSLTTELRRGSLTLAVLSQLKTPNMDIRWFSG